MNRQTMRGLPPPASSPTGLATLILATLGSSGGAFGLVSDLSTLLWPIIMTAATMTSVGDVCSVPSGGDGVVGASRSWGGRIWRGHLLVATVVSHPRHADLRCRPRVHRLQRGRRKGQGDQ